MYTVIYTVGNKSNCGPNTYAWVYPSDWTQKVHICEYTFGPVDYSEKVQTVVHELSHFDHIGATSDSAPHPTHDA